MGIEAIANESCEMVVAKSALVLPQSSPDLNSQKPAIEPATPDSKRENVAEEIDKCSSPETLVSSPPSMICSDSILGDSCNSLMEEYLLTPEECVFDPFAPGAEKFLLAPLRRKYMDESRTSAARRLDFSPTALKLVMEIDDTSKLETSSEESDLFDSLYNIILHAIVSEQSEERLDVVSPEVLGSDEEAGGCTTPKSVPCLSWISETCPGAPMKTSRKSRNIDLDLCRKLEF